MKFNPITKRLFADDGRLIKQLQCRRRVSWDQFAPTADGKARLCDQCDHLVFDTAQFTEEGLVALMSDNPSACLKVDFNQDNLTIIHRDAHSRK